LPDGSPLPGAECNLRSEPLLFNQSQFTQSQGRASFQNFRVGEFGLTVSMDGFVTQKTTVKLVPEGRVQLRFEMQPVGSA